VEARRARLLRNGDRTLKKWIAVDLGGTRFRVAVGTARGDLKWRVARPTEVTRGPDAVLEDIYGAIDDALAAAGGPSAVSGIGVAAPGPLDTWQGVILSPPNMPGWTCVPLKELLEGRFGLPVLVGNDANVATVGEHRFGAGRGFDDLVYLTVSTGIGGGVIAGGRLLLGARGFAAELGHMTIDMNGERCNCGNVGCLEALASGTAIARHAREAVAAGAPTSLGELTADDITSLSVTEAAYGGDQVAVDLLAAAGRALGVGVVNVAHLFNPSRVILGGGVSMNAGPIFWDAMLKVVQARTMMPALQSLEIVPAELGDDAGLVGCIALSTEAQAT
jgi:glucokinase